MKEDYVCVEGEGGGGDKYFLLVTRFYHIFKFLIMDILPTVRKLVTLMKAPSFVLMTSCPAHTLDIIDNELQSAL